LALLVLGLLVLALDLAGGRGGRLRKSLPYVTLGGLVVALGCALALWGQEQSLFWGMLAVDPFAVFFQVLAVVGVGLVVLSAVDYLHGRTPWAGEFYMLLTFATLAITLAVGATNLLMLYLAMEFLSITSYVLAGFFREDRKSSEAALKYFLYGAIASGVMLYGMSLLYGATGSLDMREVAQTLGAGLEPSLTWVGYAAIVLLLTGFGFKIALVPFHQCPRHLRRRADARHRLPGFGLQGHRLCRPHADLPHRPAPVPGGLGGGAGRGEHGQHNAGEPGGPEADQHQAHAGLL
jgi:NADH:ubiquinone oxidoreductase subunit 2 (subunit N)